MLFEQYLSEYSVSDMNTIICCVNAYFKFAGREGIHVANLEIKKTGG